MWKLGGRRRRVLGRRGRLTTKQGFPMLLIVEGCKFVVYSISSWICLQRASFIVTGALAYGRHILCLLL